MVVLTIHFELPCWLYRLRIPPVHPWHPATRQLAQIREELFAPQCAGDAMPPRVRPSWAGSPLALSKNASNLLLLWGVPIVM